MRFSLYRLCAFIQDTTRFVEIYRSLKRVALAGELERKADIRRIFTASMRLTGESISNKQNLESIILLFCLPLSSPN